MTEYTVTEHSDLAGSKLSQAGKDKVLAALADGYEAIVHVEEWVIDEKDLQPLPGASRLVGVGGIEAETDKAWLVWQGDVETWVPKSVGELYRPGESEIDTSSSPQAFLGDYDE